MVFVIVVGHEGGVFVVMGVSLAYHCSNCFDLMRYQSLMTCAAAVVVVVGLLLLLLSLLITWIVVGLWSAYLLVSSVI